MGMEITIDNLEDMCDLMCDNNIHSCYTCKHTDNHWDESPCRECKGYTEYEKGESE